MKGNLLKGMNIVMFFLFLLNAAVQYNDPDPLLWMAIYGAAALGNLLFATNRLHWGLSMSIGGVALIWAIGLIPSLLDQPEEVSFWGIFGSVEMKTMAIELARELAGLMLVIVWMGILTGIVYFRKSL